MLKYHGNLHAFTSKAVFLNCTYNKNTENRDINSLAKDWRREQGAIHGNTLPPDEKVVYLT